MYLTDILYQCSVGILVPSVSAMLYFRQGGNRSDKFVVYDLRHHNFDKLIRNSPKAYRFLLLLVDQERKPQYLRRFADLCTPFNGFVMVLTKALKHLKHLHFYMSHMPSV